MAQPEHCSGHALIALVAGFFLVCTLSLAHASIPIEVKQMLRLGDYEGAEALLLQNAADPHHAFHLARLYQQKLVIPARQGAAFRLFKQAADAGHAEATYQLARCYERGEHAPQDLNMARDVYQRAIDLGHPRAADALARLSAKRIAPVLSIDVALRQCDETAIAEAVAARPRFNQSWMFQAIDCNGSESLYTALIRAGAKPNAVDARNNLALHKAIAREAVAAAVVLKRAGADLSKRNDQGWSASMLAERSTNPVLRKALSVGSRNPDKAKGTDLAVATRDARFRGWSPLHIAAWRDDIELVRTLLRQGTPVDQKDDTGSTALSRAIQRNNLKIAYVLLDHGAQMSSADYELVSDLQDKKLIGKIVNSTDAMVSEFFCYSIEQGKKQTLQMLFAKNVVAPAQCGDQPALVLAARNGDLSSLRSLLSMGAAIDATDELGCTALCWAIRTEHLAASHALVAAGADNKPDRNDTTPLMWAGQTGDLETVQQFVERKLNVNHQSNSGSHAMLLAAAAGHTDIVEILLANGASVDLKNTLGDTALIAAVRADNYDTARVLIAGGASTRARNAMFVSARDLLQAKDEHWQKLIDERSSFWGLVN